MSDTPDDDCVLAGIIVGLRKLFPLSPDEHLLACARDIARIIHADTTISAARMSERRRISSIILHEVADGGDLRAAMTLALTTDLSADDAIEILQRRDGSAPLAPN